MRHVEITQFDFIQILSGKDPDYHDEIGDVLLKDLVIKNELIIEKGIFDKNIHFDNVRFDNAIMINGGIFKSLNFKNCDNIVISSGQYEKLSFSDNVFQDKNRISYDVVGTENLLIDNLHVSTKRKTVIVNASITKCKTIISDNIITIAGCRIKDFRIQGKYRNTEILDFSYNTIENLSFFDCNLSNINFSNLRTLKTGSLGFVRTNFHENIKFYNVNFSKYKLKFFNESDISNILIPCSLFPTKVDIEVQSQDKELFYRTLKTINETVGNFSKFSEYRALEYDMILKNMKVSLKNVPSLILLSLNRITNFHGTKWHIAFLEIFIIGFVFFSLYLNSMNLSIREHTYQFFYFLLPIHPYDYICNSCITEKTVFFDTIHRILNSFLIYQLIVAFRRFGR